MNSLIKTLITILALTSTIGTVAQNADDLLHYNSSRAFSNTMDNVGRDVPRYMHIQRDGIPFLALCTGMSIAHGEYARLRANFPGATGFTVMGGIGKELIFNRDYKDRMSWHAGVGYYFSESNSWVVNLDIMAAKTASISDVGILADAEFNYFFNPYRRFGISLDFGFGLGELNKDDPKKIWEFGVGIIFKLFQR